MADQIRGTLHIESWFGNEIIKEINGKTVRMMNRLGRKVVSRAKSYTPVDSGRLRDSMSFEVREEGSNVVLEWGSDVEYALFVEFGTVYMSGHYMMTRAHEEVIEPLASHFTDELKSGATGIEF